MAPGQRSSTAPEGVIWHFPSDGGERGADSETGEWVGDRLECGWGQSERKFRMTWSRKT